MEYKFENIAFNSTAKKLPEDSDRQHYIGLEHLDSNSLYVSRWGSDVTPIGEKLLMKKGDILFGKRRAYQRKVGIAPFDGIFSAHGMVLRPKENIMDKDFFPFFIGSDQFMERAIRISVGGLSPTINWKDLKEQVFDIPSLDEQKSLATKLWAAYKLREEYKRLLAATDEMVKSQFIEMFGSRDFLKRLGDYVSVKTGKLDANASVEGGRYPFFTCAEKTLSIDTYAFDCNAVLLAGNGEFCVKHYDGKFNAYQRTYVIESKDESILSTKYLYAWLKDYANILKANAIGGVIKYIKLGDIINAQINLPSQDRQLEYVKIYEQADKSKFELKRSIEAIDKVIKSLINNI
ncbi:MAG: restriction endonuclease subunit S [Candidatus Cryptobacteroides sp.]|nr:restriction endonuclease subunit S [Candidatus Cryptobacteroides sp.]